jgi:pyruvate/2-oxoglutarate dehydrogenase complex dihydrolipoamide acyltransferase (E2) component
MAAHEFRLADIGEGLTEAEIVSWLVAVGDRVVEDQPVVEIETDKAVVEMPAPVTGTVVALGGEVGAVISVGSVLLVVDDGAPDGEPGAGPAVAEPSTAERARSPNADAARAAAPAARRPLATPSTRALARQLGVDLATLTGSGPGGRIVDADVAAAASAPAEAWTPAPARSAHDGQAVPAAGTRLPLRGVRKRTAENMTAAWQAVPHVDSFHEIDVTDLFAVREQFKPVAERRGVPVTLTAFFVKATALALVDHPMLNASIDVAAGEIVLHERRHVGVAVDTPDGLVLPVIRDADQLPLLDIAAELTRLGEAARERRLSPSELTGGTFTVSNHGVFGGWFGTSLVHGSEVGIAGFGPARRRPEFDADDRVVARRILVMNLAADHRVVDGRDIINFGLTIRRHLEAPLGLLFDGSGRCPEDTVTDGRR